MKYGYCRISTSAQSIERQVRNISQAYPDAEIVKETFTGTKYQGREKLERIVKRVQPGDDIIFDSVSRMSRSADEGFALYEELFRRGVNLIFLKEPHINTDTYKKALVAKVELTGDKVDYILEGVNRYLMALAREQIKIAFEQAQKEVDDLHERTREGMLTAKLNGKQIGQKKGAKLNVKKSEKTKMLILQHSKDFGGTLTDKAVMQLAGVTAKTFYKYKKELKDAIGL